MKHPVPDRTPSHPPRTDHSRTDGGRAFLPDPFAHGWASSSTSPDALAEGLAEEFLASATSGEEVAADERDEVQTEELGGPFSITSAQEEYGATANEEIRIETPEPAKASVGSFSRTRKSMKHSLT